MSGSTPVDAELGAQYAIARIQRPSATAEEIAALILARLGAEHRSTLAAEAVLWAEQPGDSDQLALTAVHNFIAAWEADPDQSG